jgi:hypothetical protein
MDTPINTEESTKLVVLANKRFDTGVVMNAVAHTVAGLINRIGEDGRSKLKFLDFEDFDGQKHRSISARSFIILRGTDGDIRKVRQRAQEVGIPHVSFVSTMTGDTYVEQLARTRATPTLGLTFYAIALVGHADELHPITKRYSLWRGESSACDVDAVAT